MKKEKARDIAIRAAKTFLQAFLGSISVETVLATTDRSIWRSVLISGVAAGISAVMNLIIASLDNDTMEV
ncbi:MAG: hypothetical protein J6U54_03455 [Clostridiales bacterium]|nr:hypothetical protein [Clostridiales bacterium]